MKPLAAIVFFGIIASLVAGCVTLGRPIPAQVAPSIVIGQTTRAEIEAQLGPPYRVGLDSGNPSVTYLYYRIGLFIQPVTTDLTVVFNAEGKVQSYDYNTNQTDAPGDDEQR